MTHHTHKADPAKSSINYQVCSCGAVKLNKVPDHWHACQLCRIDSSSAVLDNQRQEG